MSCVYVNDLPQVENVIDKIVAPPQYEDKDIDELRESIQLIITEFLRNNAREYAEEDIEQQIFEHVKGIMSLLYDCVFEIFDDINIDDHITEGICLYFNLMGTPRSCPVAACRKTPCVEDISKRIDQLRKKSQPEQRTAEWYQFRWNKITASSAWKALNSQTSKNQLIYSKCVPIDSSRYSAFNVGSAAHHGNKYEDISKAIYEKTYGTVVEEFGCLEDESDDFIGASPDGINVKKDNILYGRLIEIKNPVSRKITGTPKREYWVQMQMQMHVTKLHLCDFFETQIKEYESEEAFLKDGTFTHTEKGQRKGIILCFHDGSRPMYEAAPLDCSECEFAEWSSRIIDAHNHLTWIMNSYWWLESSSCVLVPYNADWMDAVLPEFRQVWETVLYEREHGYSHRKPKKRQKREKLVSPLVIATVPEQLPQKNAIIKVRTESFDESHL